MGTPIRRGDAALIEQPDSPKWTFGESITAVRTFLASSHSVALSAAPMRGAQGTGEFAGLRVRESVVTKVRGGQGSLTITFESQPGAVPGQGSQLPADELEIVNEKIEQDLRKHPRYAALGQAMFSYINTLLEVKFDDPSVPEAQNQVFSNELAYELFLKLQRGATHYALYVPVYRWIVYSWTPFLDLEVGGFIETPINDVLPPPGGYQWLREGDRTHHNGAAWVKEMKWLGAPEWDADIYY